MATFKAIIYQHHKKADGTYKVKIRVIHKRKIKYIPTEIHVSKEDITKSLKIKNQSILDTLDATIKRYRDIINSLGERLDAMSVDQIIEHIQSHKNNNKSFSLDFINFGREHVKYLEENNQIGTAKGYAVTLNSLERFIGPELDINTITTKFLNSYVSWLDASFGTKENSVRSRYLSSIKTLHNLAKLKYNDEDLGNINIPLSPFKKFEMPKARATKKRALPAETIQAISHIPYEDNEKRGGKYFNLAKDVFMLSFGLIGMNTVDLLTCPPIKNGRLTYNRTKTKTRRSDRAEISIKIEPEILTLIEKYKDPDGKRAFSFYQMFKDHYRFNAIVNKYLKKIGSIEIIGIDNLQFYAARHSWATIAMNKARVDKYTVHAALNHSDPTMAITDIYIEKDYSLIDEANRKVLDYVKLEIPEIVDVLQEK
ncbi:MAG: tyrosine-type recombinase/integrase [Solitalea-like symbiont of Acarus siro]